MATAGSPGCSAAPEREPDRPLRAARYRDCGGRSPSPRDLQDGRSGAGRPARPGRRQPRAASRRGGRHARTLGQWQVHAAAPARPSGSNGAETYAKPGSPSAHTRDRCRQAYRKSQTNGQRTRLFGTDLRDVLRRAGPVSASTIRSASHFQGTGMVTTGPASPSTLRLIRQRSSRVRAGGPALSPRPPDRA